MIDKLTKEQEDSMSIYRDRWIQYGLDTSPLDYDKAINAVKLVYEIAEKKPPKYFLFADGPLEAMKFLAIAEKVDLTEDDFDRLSMEDHMSLTHKIREYVIANPDFFEGKSYLLYPSSYGQHYAGWLGFYEFFRDHFGIAEKSLGLCEVGKTCGWVWMYDDLVVISRKPIRVTLDGLGRLHNEKVAAVEYLDGTKVYAFNGVTISEEWVLQRDTIDPSVILECRDTDKRAAGIALFGYHRLKTALKYKIVEGDPSTDIGALVEISIPGLREKGRFLEAICPRNGPVFLGVPKTNPWDNDAPIVDAVGAQAFLARLPRSAYEHPPIRT
jgi:hypothetical protein